MVGAVWAEIGKISFADLPSIVENGTVESQCTKASFKGQAASLDEDKCLNDILNRSPNRKKDILAHDVSLKIKAVSDFLNLCNGHDFQKAFALCVSATSTKGVNDVEIGKAFRVAYRFDDFKKSDLYRQLKAWADSRKKTLFI